MPLILFHGWISFVRILQTKEGQLRKVREKKNRLDNMWKTTGNLWTLYFSVLSNELIEVNNLSHTHTQAKLE